MQQFILKWNSVLVTQKLIYCLQKIYHLEECKTITSGTIQLGHVCQSGITKRHNSLVVKVKKGIQRSDSIQI